MAIRPTIQIGDPRLKAPNQTISNFVDEKLSIIIQDLVETMRHNELIGMAAQQIGENYKLFITEPRETPVRTIDQADILRVYINPKITWYSDEKVIIFEGCGSVANGQIFGPVERPKVIKIDYFDNNGRPHWLKCDGILARVIQHEYDHLMGIEFTEKIYDYKQLMIKEWYIEKIKPNPIYAERSKITIKESDV